MVDTIFILCPPMPVNNTGWGLRSDRRAIELLCSGHVVISGFTIPFSSNPERAFRFESCLVKWKKVGQWTVDPVMSWGYLADGSYIEMHWPEEPVIRRGLLMEAQPIDCLASRSFYKALDGTKYRIQSTMPASIGRPQGIFGLGMFQYIVDEVKIEGILLK